MSVESNSLQFVPVSSFIQHSFWNKVANLKINIDGLKETERQIWGFFSNVACVWNNPVVEVDSTSFNSKFGEKNKCLPFHGTIFNKNTIENFKECDKTELINSVGAHFFANLNNGKLIETPSLLNQFLILSFSDLKKYHFYYWFAFPVPHKLKVLKHDCFPVGKIYSNEQLDVLMESYNQLDQFQKAYFLVHKNQTETLAAKLGEITLENVNEYCFAFANYKIENNYPITQLKNFIVLILHYCPFLNGKTVKFLSLSLTRFLSAEESVIFELVLPEFGACKNVQELVNESGLNSWAGWEKNENNKFVPRFSNMKATMNPEVLFEESVDLNLKLMKWRLLPNIDLDKIKGLKCLLLGAGTLGCSVARTLMGWGVRNITFVDNSTVSFSNPVRQSLFTYEDSISSKPKAEAAAANLKKIFPAINSQAFQLTIPMPGHSIGEATLQTTQEAVNTLEKLTADHDFIFLLTDSRESRWLPTLLALKAKKTIINVALGFDTYLVMRYGGDTNRPNGDSEPPNGFKRIPGLELGCYFCNDVTAPGNSMKDRTLDQQCTVARPGLSAIAGALAVELAVSLSQHQDGAGAPAYYKTGNGGDCLADVDDQSVLGLLPHSIRGFLSSFSTVLPATPKYSKCIACSSIVLDAYEKDGFGFLLQAFNSSKVLEDLTGLSALFNEDNFAGIVEMDDSEEWTD